MRTTIRMNEELARRAKQYAARTRRTFTEVVEQAVTELLSKPTTRGRRIVLPTSGTGRSRPVTDAEYRARIEQLYEEDAARYLRGGHGSTRR